MTINVFDYCVGDINELNDFDGLVKAFAEKYEYVGEGRSRIVFARNDRFVIKVPRNNYGLVDNWHERYWRNKQSCLCRLYKNVILIMERVDTNIDRSNLPEWTYYIDCRQVGLTKSKKLKACDFGLY